MTLNNLSLGAIKICILGFGRVGKTELIRLICGEDVNLEYVPTINADMISYEGDEFERRITLWDFAGPDPFRSPWRSLLQETDITLLIIDSTFEIINRSKEIVHELLDKYYQDKLIIGLANYQDMPNRLTPKFCERILSDYGRIIKFHDIDTCNPVYREKILAILRNAIIKVSNGKEEIICEQCGNNFTREFFEILNQADRKVKDLSYCPKCNFPLRYIYYENCLQIRSSNPLIKSEAVNNKDLIPNKRFRKQWIDYVGIILKKRDQVYSNIELEYIEEQNKLDNIAEKFFSGSLDKKIFEIYNPYVEKCNFPANFEEELKIPKCYFVEKGDVTYIIIGVLLDPNFILEKMVLFIEKFFYNNQIINFKRLDKSVKGSIRYYMEHLIERIEEYLRYGDLTFLTNLENLFTFRTISRPNSYWKSKLVNNKLKREGREIHFQDTSSIIRCPMCGSNEVKMVEDKSKILSYVSVVPMYARKYICKRCGYEF